MGLEFVDLNVLVIVCLRLACAKSFREVLTLRFFPNQIQREEFCHDRTTGLNLSIEGNLSSKGAGTTSCYCRWPPWVLWLRKRWRLRQLRTSQLKFFSPRALWTKFLEKWRAYISDIRVKPWRDLHLADRNIKCASMLYIVKIASTKRQIIDLSNFYRHVRYRLNLFINLKPRPKLRASPDIRSIHNFLQRLVLSWVLPISTGAAELSSVQCPRLVSAESKFSGASQAC